MQIEQLKQNFEKQLAQLNQSVTAESTEQARGVLLALPTADAVDNLMQLSLQENIILLKGMQEKSIGKLLQQFLRESDQKKRDRAHEIFEAISQGEPSLSSLNDAIDNLTSTQTKSPQ